MIIPKTDLIMLCVIAHVSLMGLYIFYILWQRAKEELTRYHSSLDLEADKRKATMTSTMVDTPAIICGDKDSSLKLSLQTKSITTPTSIAEIIYFIRFPIMRVYKWLKSTSLAL